MTQPKVTLVFLLFLLSTLHPATAEEWGTLKGTFVFDGEPPTPSPLSITKDAEVCGIHKLVDESLIVNPSNKGIADVVISLSLERRQKAPAVHESYKSTANAEVRLDNENCRFQPHVTLLRTGQTLIVGNKDTVGHNTKVDTIKNSAINPIVPAGGEIKQVYQKEERLPARVSCSIHPWMTAWVVVKDVPYFAVTDEDGAFQIANLPAGKWTFQIWHGKSGYIDQATRDGKQQKWKKGKMEVEIKVGENDLGTISVPATLFN